MEAIQSGRQLMRFASPRQEQCRDTLLRIPGASRTSTIQIESRRCTIDELEGHCSLFGLPIVDQHRRIRQRLQRSSLNGKSALFQRLLLRSVQANSGESPVDVQHQSLNRT